MDKENMCPNSFFFHDDSSFDDMPELTDSSDTSEQVEEEPYLLLSDNTGLQFRAWYPAPHVCFWNAYSSCLHCTCFVLLSCCYKGLGCNHTSVCSALTQF